jgi:hemin uptake protein HemP
MERTQGEERNRTSGPAVTPLRVSSESLLGQRGELLIVHNGREYRLRLTQNGKLILTA